MDLCLIILCIFLTFSFCFSSDYISDRITLHGRLTYNLHWYLLPPKFGKYFFLIILQAQAPVQFNGLQIIYMSLNTFTNVSPFLPQLNAKCVYNEFVFLFSVYESDLRIYSDAKRSFTALKEYTAVSMY